MPHKSHYGVLEVASTAPLEEIKRAFRSQIARYHPDKVHHLGTEFQEMAASRAAELTEAYRVLSNEAQRAEYDRALATSGLAPAGPAVPPQPVPGTPPPEPASPPQAEAPRSRATPSKESASRDQFVRKATADRIRQALAQTGTEYNDTQAAGFDIALVPKPKLFGGGKRPRLLGRFVEPVDGAAVAEAWPLAVRWLASSDDGVCVFLMGSSVASARELAEAIAVQRRRNRTANVTIIPVDVRTWDAHIPVDTHLICKDLLTRLKSGK